MNEPDVQQPPSGIAPRASSILSFYDLTKTFDGHVALNGVTGELHRGEVVLLRGDNGSGKTTLLNVLTGNLEADAGRIDLRTNGAEYSFRFPRPWYENLNPFDHYVPERVAREGVARTWQEVRLFETMTLRDNLAVAARGQTGESFLGALFRPWKARADEQSNRADADAMLAGLGLEGRENSSADRVSLGQGKRVAIARAVRAGARVLFLDEPLAGLDDTGIEQVLVLLRRLARTEGVTMVIVEHVFNILRLLDLADTVWTLTGGHLTADPASAVRRSPRPGSESLQPWIQALAEDGWVVREKPLNGGATLSLISRNEQEGATTLLELSHVLVRRGQRLVVGFDPEEGARGLTFGLRTGDLAVLSAPNGWGKTTLIQAIAGLLPVEDGRVMLQGQQVDGAPPWSRRELGLSVLQSRNALFQRLRVEETLRLAGVSESQPELLDLFYRRVGSLSGGERQRAAIACAMDGGVPRILVLDEPFGMLDDRRVAWARDKIIAAVDRGCAVLIAAPGFAAA